MEGGFARRSGWVSRSISWVRGGGPFRPRLVSQCELARRHRALDHIDGSGLRRDARDWEPASSTTSGLCLSWA
jgi:hypothetical protein